MLQTNWICVTWAFLVIIYKSYPQFNFLDAKSCYFRLIDSYIKIQRKILFIYLYNVYIISLILQVLAAEGEHKASKALKEAADIIHSSPAALQLRYLQTLNTIASEKNSTVVFPLPIDILPSFLKWLTYYLLFIFKFLLLSSSFENDIFLSHYIA